MEKTIDEGYKLIPMSEITDEARMIAKSWYDGVSEMNDIREKHKLASDIMNYALNQMSKVDEIRVAEAKLRRDLQLRNEGLVKAMEKIRDYETMDEMTAYHLKVIAREALTQYNQVNKKGG